MSSIDEITRIQYLRLTHHNIKSEMKIPQCKRSTINYLFI